MAILYFRSIQDKFHEDNENIQGTLKQLKAQGMWQSGVKNSLQYFTCVSFIISLWQVGGGHLL